jgi:GDPmannose 4,6-dehydratase
LEAGKEVININPGYFRPTEVDLLIGDLSKAHSKLGWFPEYVLKELVSARMARDIELMQKDRHLLDNGY